MKPLILYARKSTDVEDKQVQSIDAQLAELREFAEREQIHIVAELIEKESAKYPGRPIFNAMLARIEAGEAEGILAWHPDRLARNSIDGGRIIYHLDQGIIKTLKFPTFRFESDPQGKFMLNIMFGQSKYYVDALSENTKRGIREKLRKGEFPGRAPFGYYNEYRTKKILVDPKLAPLVIKAFELYASGEATLDRLRAFFGEQSVATRNGYALGREHMTKMLTNPFYYGHFRYKGDTYEGVHKPIISKALFDEANAVLSSRWRYAHGEQKPVQKPFLGLLRCATCGGAITAEIQKGHIYYRCTKKGRMVSWCEQPYIRQEALEMEITSLLKPYTLREDWADEMLTRLEDEKKQSAQALAQQVAQKRLEIEKLNLKMKKLLDTFLDDLVDRETFAVEKSRLMSQKKTLEEQKERLQVGRADWLEPFQSWILTAKNTGKIAVSGSSEDKRGLALKIFGSNLVLDCKKARGCCVKPWSLLGEKSQTGGMVPLYTAARTFFQGLRPL